jgi:hypothetical protein
MSRSAVVYLGPSDASDIPLPDGLTSVGSFEDSTPHERDGLRPALGAIAAGDADTLFVPRLAYAAASLGALLRLVEWLEGAGASLVAADVELDTAKRSGRRGIALLEEVDRWGREGDQRRRPRGRPGLRTGSPELVQRIAALRAEGLSLQAIAARLNADGVPTPRGGASWRPSSVQSALGYRRPGPPGPGPPPPPRPPHGKPPHPPGPMGKARPTPKHGPKRHPRP